MKSVKYGIVIEKGDRNCAAYVPDLPGCIATGATVEETKERIREAILLHLKRLREDGDAIPAPGTVCEIGASEQFPLSSISFRPTCGMNPLVPKRSRCWTS